MVTPGLEKNSLVTWPDKCILIDSLDTVDPHLFWCQFQRHAAGKLVHGSLGQVVRKDTRELEDKKLITLLHKGWNVDSRKKYI